MEALDYSDLLQNSVLSEIFPNDIIIDILSRLPVKSICRFKCTSKPWCDLLNCPKFINKHLNQSISKSKTCYLIRHLVDPREKIYTKSNINELRRFLEEMDLSAREKGFKIFRVKVGNAVICIGRYLNDDEVYSLRDSENFFLELGRFELPAQSKSGFFSLIGSCNGLIYLNECNFNSAALGFNGFLWNPATREIRAIPSSSHGNSFTTKIVVVGIAFLHVPLINDYRVVRLVYYSETKLYEIVVYSMENDSWRKVGFTFHLKGKIVALVSEAYVNGSLHWLVTNRDEKLNYEHFILSFNLIEESLSNLVLPEPYQNEEIPSPKLLSEFKGKLVLLVMNRVCEIWVMNDYGVAKSWTKAYTCQISGVREAMIPRGILDNGKIVMESRYDGELLLYDMNNADGSERRSTWILQPARIIMHMESLVSPYGRRHGLNSAAGPSSRPSQCGTGIVMEEETKSG